MELRVAPGDWGSAIADCDGPQLVVAGPGAGKTEFLVRRAAHLIGEDMPSDNVLLLSFSRRGAADLASRLRTRVGDAGGEMEALTFHAFAWRVLEAYAYETFGWGEMPALLTGPEQVAFVARLLSCEDPGRWPVAFRPMLTSRTLALEVTDFLLRAFELRLTPEDLQALASSRDDWRALGEFATRYNDALAAAGRIDYGSVQSRAVDLLGHDAVRDSIRLRFAHVLCDEYQDTTHAQALLLEELYRAVGNLTAAGDPYQSIYSFRGAELSNVAEFPTRFLSPDGTPARRIVLTTSFRVPAAILDAAVALTHGQDLPGGAGPVEAARPGGSVAAHRFDQQTEEAEWIAAEAEHLHVIEGIPYSSMAVAVRTKRRLLAELSRALDRRRIPHDRPDRRLADQPAVRMISALAAAAGGHDVDGSMRVLLLGPWFGLPWGQVREWERARSDGTLWPDLLRRSLAPLADLLEDASWATKQPAAAGLWHLWRHLPNAGHIANEPESAADRQALTSLFQVADRLGERDPEATLDDYISLLEEESFEATPLLSYSPGEGDRLTLTTLHQAKGMEFDVVFIADATEGAFPDLRPRDSLLGSRALSPSHPKDPVQYRRFRLQEETRLAYTAMTRARRRVVWTTTATGYDEGQGVPSRFLDRIAAAIGDPLGPPPRHSTPAGPRDAESILRRLLADPAAGAGRRLAAAAALAGGGRYGLRTVDSFGGVRRRGGGTSPAPFPRHLSPTAAESYLACPRRYYLERRVAGPLDSVYLRFGSAVHGILHTAEEEAQRRGDAHATVSEAVALVSDHVTDDEFGGPAVGPWWRRRAEALLVHLYSKWPADSRSIVALEHEVTVDLGGITWRGRIDRIERLGDGSIRIVDYKTSKKAMRKVDAAASVQLGFYLQAASDDPSIEGPAWSAELWYPASDTKYLTRRRYDPGNKDLVDDMLRRAADGIRRAAWPEAATSDCERCSFRSSCPAWPEGREAFVA